MLGRRYRLEARVAGGGMGEVWRGHDSRLDRVVAVKILHASLAAKATFRRRFLSEAHALAQLQVPGVVDLYDYGEDHDQSGNRMCYLVMEYVEGDSLADLLVEQGRLDHLRTMSIIAQAAQALHNAHRAAVIHRDVKPENILVDHDGRVTLVDFGIALAGGDSGLTATGVIMGTVSYVSPEQLRNQDASPASDIYALGVVAYECLAGRRPFLGDSPAAIIAGHLHEIPARLPDEVPEQLATVLDRALTKDPTKRWRNAAEFASACRAAATEVTLARSARRRGGQGRRSTNGPLAGAIGAARAGRRHRGRHRKDRTTVGSAALSLLHRGREVVSSSDDDTTAVPPA